MADGVRADGTRGARTVVLIATVALFGAGVEHDPVREVIDLWLPSGQHVARLDPNSSDETLGPGWGQLHDAVKSGR